jgi:squalene cyclase
VALPGGSPKIRPESGYAQLETYRQLAVLVCKYGLDHRHPAIARAAGFLVSIQTEAGDNQGVYGRQYTPNYSAAITEVLIAAGYHDSEQVDKNMRWLLAMRQDDGGWATLTRTRGLSLTEMLTTGSLSKLA